MLPLRKISQTAIVLFIVSVICSCGNGKSESDRNDAESGSAGKHLIPSITSEDTLNDMLERAGDNLVVLDLYADWCRPCRILAPVLERIAEANSGRAVFYRINVDRVPEVARTFDVRGIPLVVFMKKKVRVESLVGVNPAEEYLRIIDQYAKK